MDDLVKRLRFLARGAGDATRETCTSAADRLEAIQKAWRMLSFDLKPGGMGTQYLADNDNSRRSIAALRSAIEGTDA